MTLFTGVPADHFEPLKPPDATTAAPRTITVLRCSECEETFARILASPVGPVLLFRPLALEEEVGAETRSPSTLEDLSDPAGGPHRIRLSRQHSRSRIVRRLPMHALSLGEPIPRGDTTAMAHGAMTRLRLSLGHVEASCRCRPPHALSIMNLANEARRGTRRIVLARGARF